MWMREKRWYKDTVFRMGMVYPEPKQGWSVLERNWMLPSNHLMQILVDVLSNVQRMGCMGIKIEQGTPVRRLVNQLT